MRWNSLRRLRTSNVAHAFSTPSCRPAAAVSVARRAPIAQEVDVEAEEAPIFSLVKFLSGSAGTVPKAGDLSKFGVQVDEYQRWTPAIEADTLEKAWPYISTDDQLLVANVPTWLVLSLLLQKVVRPEDVPLAVSLARDHLRNATPAVRPTILTLTTSRLIAHRAYDQLESLVLTFVRLQGLQSIHVTRMLRTLFTTRQTSALVAKAVSALAARDLNLLSSFALDALFSSTYMTAHLGSTFLRLVARHGLELSVTHWKTLMSIFAFRGWRKRLRYSWKRLRSQHPHCDTSDVPYAKYLEARRRLPAESVLEENVIDLKNTIEFTNAFTSLSRVLSHMKLRYPRHLREWQHVFQALLVQPKVHSRTLFRTLRLARTDQQCRSDLDIHLMAIDGFVHRRAYVRALCVWKIVVQQKLGLTPWSLTAGIKTLAYTGDASKAFELLLSFSPRGSPPKKRAIVDTQTVNTFMVTLQRLRRHDVVFQLWGHFEPLFGLTPTHHTLCIFMKSAILGSDIDFSIRGVLTSIGLGALVRAAPAHDLDVAAAATRRIHELLAHSPYRSTAGTFHGEPAGDAALRIADRFFLTHFPALRTVVQPVYALRPSAAYPAERPVTDLARSLLGDPLAASKCPWNQPPVLAPGEDTPDRSLRHVIATDVVFRTYIDLLAAMNKVPRVPLALAWARALGVPVSRTTLATALVYWHEICVDAPLLEYYKRGRSSGQYQQLVEWMKKWVGEKAMPTDVDVQEQFSRVYALRRMRNRLG
ncbi:hypothetical protein OBBRIDRAFT_825677 [Obba rivulosa]|uniref:Uncharacterized protein n=1 Tax=Obba rivulosa TaxID=1052685 RepID=A0A8E2AV18_9APHY|nr:hypothetical protein OBBRIDRAFT_825677 [Obba rivulosa]